MSKLEMTQEKLKEYNETLNHGIQRNNGQAFDINALLAERGKIHGDAETTHKLAMDLWNLTVDSSVMSEASMCMLMIIMVKIARGVQNPKHADHWIDIGGYAELIKRVECKD